MPTAFSDSVDGSIDTDLSRITIGKDWSELAIDDDSEVLKSNKYAIRLRSRNDEVITSRVDNIRYRDEVDAAQNPQFDIPPKDLIIENQLEYLSGDIQLFIDGVVAFAGEVLKIETSQTEGDNISIKAKSPGRRLADDSVDFQPDNTVLQDVMAKMVDRTNDFHTEMDDELPPSSSTNVNITDDVIFTDGSSGSVEFNNLHPDASEIEYINVKAFTSPNINLIIKVDEDDEEDFVYELSDLDFNNFGEWEMVEVPSFPEASYDLHFELDDGSILFDWIIITSRDVVRTVDPPVIESIGEEEFFYDRSGSELEEEAIEWEDDDGLVWTGNSFRNAQKGIFYAIDDDYINTTSDPNATNGVAWLGDSGNIGGSIGYSSSEPIESWELHYRVKTTNPEELDEDSDLGLYVEVDGDRSEFDGFIPPDDDYEWRSLVSWDDPQHDDWPEDITNSQIEVGSLSSSDVDINICSFYLAHGVVSDKSYTYVFDNELNEPEGHLDRPYEYVDTTEVEFTGVSSEENITDALTEVSFSNISDPVVSNWGPTQRVSDTAGYPAYPGDTSISSSFPYTGVDHQVRVRLTASGQERNTDSPRRGYQSMSISSYEVFTSTNDLEIVFDQTLSGNRLQVLSELADSSTFHYRWDGNDCQIFQRGTRKTSPGLRKEGVESSVGIEDVYSSAEVFGFDGIHSGIIEAENPPDFIDRHKEIRDPDIETELDAIRRAIGFLRDNSSIEYEGNITTLPTFAPVGEEIDGSIFSHGQDMIIEEVDYGKRRSNITLGFKQKLSRKIRGLDDRTTSITRRQTTASN